MKLRDRAECVKYASDSEQEVSTASVVVMNQRRRKVKASSDVDLSADPEAGSLLRYTQPNVKNTNAALCPMPEMPLMVEDSDEDFMEARVSLRKRRTSQANGKGSKAPHAKRNNSNRSARKSYKELTSSEEEGEQNELAGDYPDLSTFCFTKEEKSDETKKVLVPGRRRLVKVASSTKGVEESPCVLSEEDHEAHSDADEALSDAEGLKLRKSKRVLSKRGCNPTEEQQDLKKEDAKPTSLTDIKALEEPVALNLDVNAYGLCTLEGASVCNLVKRVGQVEKVLAVQDRGIDSMMYSIKECDKSYRSVVVVKESLLKSKCPQLLRNFCKRMDELERVSGNPGDREDVPAFNPQYLHIDRVIGQEERRGSRKYYLIKWCGLPYSEATWELLADLTFKEDQVAIDRYAQIHSRSSSGIPTTDGGKLLFKDGRLLRDYQEKGLAWMDHNFQNHVNCILADEMGLGKTMQAVSMLQNLRAKRKIRGPFLVIAPVSTLGHWQREVESLTDMNCVVFSGSAEDRKIIKQYDYYYPKSHFVKFNVLLTSFEILMKEQGFVSKQEWQYVVVDEAHRLKSKCSKTTCCLKQLMIRKGGLLLLTGTPIQNNTKEIFSLLNLLDPQQFCSEEDFLLKYGDLKNAEQVKDLQENVLRPRLLRRLKEDVEKSIPLKEETIIWVELTKEQRCYYRAILQNRITDLLKGSQSNNIPNLRNVAMELRKLCNHPFLCNGLQEDITSKLKLQEADNSSEALCMSSGKMMLLEKLLPMLKNAGHRVLVFSQFAIMLDLLEDYLTSKNYSYERIDGSVCGSERQAAIDRYSAKDSDTFLFLLSTRAGGLGITLTAADTCIIYDSDWNPQNDLQAMARCHRIGQKKDVRIYRLITKDTYEQHLFECSSRKYGLDEAILGGMQGAITDNDYSANIENLLKKGAYSILREDGEAEAAAFHAQNIEQILESRTEKRLVGGRGQNTFSVATFVSNPSTDSLANVETSVDGDPMQFWQELLPEACSAALNDDKPPVLMSCGPRKRMVVNYREGRGNSEPESSGEENETTKSRRHRVRKKHSQEPGPNNDIKQWSEKELKQLENSLIEFGASRTEDIMMEAGLQQHGIEEVQQLCDVLIQLCLYFEARNATASNSNSGPLPESAALGQSAVRAHQLPPEGSDCCVDQTQGWNASTFRDTSSEAPILGGMQMQQDGKAMEASKDGDEKIQFPSVIMHPKLGKVAFPTIPPFAQKALRSQALSKRLEKKATRYLEAMRERQTLARAVCEGRIPPLYVRSFRKKLPIWWREEEDRDLLLGAHRHGTHNLSKIREDKSLCFSSKPDVLKFLREEEDLVLKDADAAMINNPPSEPIPHPDQEEWPQDAVFAARLRYLIQSLRNQEGLPGLPGMDKRKALDETAPKWLSEERERLKKLLTSSERTTALLLKAYPKCEPVPSKKCHSVSKGMSTSSRPPRVELCNHATTSSPLQSATVHKLASAVDPLPTVKSKDPHAERSRGKESLHSKKILNVPNSSSEGSGDENFQRRHFREPMAGPLADRQWLAPAEKAYPINMGGAFPYKKPSKEMRRPENLSIMRCESSLTHIHDESKDVRLHKEDRGSTPFEVKENRWRPTSLVNTADWALPIPNQREPLLELNEAKRKTSIEAPLPSNKKHKDARKQQTLHGFLAQRVAPKATKSVGLM